MTPERFIQKLHAARKEIKSMIRSKLPRMAGKTAVDHFRENFMKGGFVNGGVQRWKLPKRFNADGKTAASKYGTLLSARKELYNSITYRATDGIVIISTDKEYAEVHNEGFSGTVNIPQHERTSTKKATVFSIKTKKSKKVKTEGYRFMVRTHKRRMNMPQRQFIGNSKELNNKIQNILETEISKLL